MTFRGSIEAVLRGGDPDQVPYAPYDNLVPRGDFERELRNRGMGLCLRRSGIWSESPNVDIERKTKGDLAYTIYRTPKGSVQSAERTHVGRISDGETIEEEWMIKGSDDFAPAIFMVDDAIYHSDYPGFLANIRDVGTDGIVRFDGPVPPYDASETYFSLEDWAQAQHDYPKEFAQLMAALERRLERFMPLVLDAPAEFISMGSLSGIYSPRRYEESVIPFYEKWVPELTARGKLPALHAHNSNLNAFVDLVKRTGVPIVEAFTPPPIGDFSLADARAAWGPDVVIWVNFPETIFWHGRQETYDYTVELLTQDKQSRRLVIGMTEMGSYGITDDESERIFKEGMRAIMDAIEEHGLY